MIVILLKDVKGTGKAGDIVKVSDGYAEKYADSQGNGQGSYGRKCEKP